MIFKKSSLIYILAFSLVGGFFSGIDSITDPASGLIFNPLVYTLFNGLFFIPIVLISLIYMRIYQFIGNEKKISPSLGLWICGTFGVILVVVIFVYLVSLNSNEIFEKGAKLRELTQGIFYIFLLFSSISVPLIDLIVFKKKGKKIKLTIFLFLIIVSIVYHLFIFILTKTLYYFLNVFLMLVMWG